MQKIKIAAIALFIGILLIVAILFVVGYFRPLKAGLVIDTNPASLVYVDGVQVGRTRYEGTRKPGEVVVKLIPESSETPLAPYEAKINLTSRVKTIIQRDFSVSEDKASGVLVSFEKAVRGETSVSVVTVPDSANITIDGQIRGNAPLKTTSITEGEHTLTVSAPDYQEKSINIRTYRGYKLIAVVKLAYFPPPKEPAEDSSIQPTPAPKIREIEILNTPTGYLRVRVEPSTLAEEVGQVEPGKRYPLVDTDKETGWYKIEYEKDKQGWVSKQYAKEISDAPSPTPAVSSTPAPR